jgi:hypothetical protein
MCLSDPIVVLAKNSCMNPIRIGVCWCCSWQSFRNTNESLVVAETLVKLKNNLDNLYHDIDEVRAYVAQKNSHSLR